MARLLIDTTVFIDHLRGRELIRPRGNNLAYSVIVRAELYTGGDERRIDIMLDRYEELPVDRAVAERAGRLRRDTKIDMADALIAATALVHGFTVITRNVADFRGVSKLRARSEI